MNKEISKWLSDYDNGNEVESVSMGGMGHGYECAIQDCAIETLRALPEVPPEDKQEFRDVIENASNHAVRVLDGVHGFSGAQVGAAKNMASVFWRQTPTKGLDMIRNSDPERIIKIVKGENGHPKIASGDVGE